MEVHFKPETESRLQQLASKRARATLRLVADALAAYSEEVEQVRQMLDSRYDQIQSAHVQALNGETFSERLRQREDELIKEGSRR